MKQKAENYCKAYRDAEQHVKCAEKTIQSIDPTGKTDLTGGTGSLRGILIPSINELRYAGWHAVRALEAQNNEDRAVEWDSAEDHCFRASYDAFDAQLQYIVGECAIFQNDYRRGVEISRVISDYQEDCRILNKLKRVDYRQIKSRGDHWKDMQQHVETLLPILEKWNTARDELNKILQDGLFNRWLKVTGTIVLVVGTVVAILKLF